MSVASRATPAQEELPAIFTPRVDLLCFALLLAIALAAAPWLRVYYRVTVVRTELVAIDAAGERRTMPTPPELDLAAARTRPADELPRRAEAAFRVWAADPARTRDGVRYEWRIAWSADSRALDRSLVLVHPQAAGGDR